MAIKVTMTGSGEIGEIQPGWSSNEFATPNTIGENSGGTGTVNINAKAQPTSNLIANNSITTTHDKLGSISGTVKSVSTTGGTVSLTHSTTLAKFDANENIPALESGGVFPAVDLCLQLLRENRLKSDLPGWFTSLTGHSTIFDASGNRIFGDAYYTNYDYYNPTTGKFVTERVASAINSVQASGHEYFGQNILDKKLYANDVIGDSFSPDPNVANVQHIAYKLSLKSDSFIPHTFYFGGDPVDYDFDYGFTGSVVVSKTDEELRVAFSHSEGGFPVDVEEIVSLSGSGLDLDAELYLFIKYSFDPSSDISTKNSFYLSASLANVNDITNFVSAQVFMQKFSRPTWYSAWRILGLSRSLWRYSEVIKINEPFRGPLLRTNFINNSSFETNFFAEFSASTRNVSGALITTTLTQSSVKKLFGTYSLKSTPAANGIVTSILQKSGSRIPVTGGKFYCFSGYALANSTTVGKSLALYFSFFDANNVELGSTSVSPIEPNLSTSTWNRASYTALAPANAVWAQTAIGVLSNSLTTNSDMTTYFDGFMFEEVESVFSEPTSYFDGSFDVPGFEYLFDSAENILGATVSKEYALQAVENIDTPIDYENIPRVINEFGVVGGPVNGFSGNMWEYLQYACSAYGQQIFIVPNETKEIVINDVGTTILDLDNVVASPSISPSATLTGKSIDIVYQDSENIIDGVVYDAYEDDDNKVLSVEATKITEVTLNTNSYLTTVFQPERRFELPNADGCYIISDNTGLRLPTVGVINLDTTAASGNGTTATITTKSPHGIQAGDVVTIKNIVPTGYRGTFTVTNVPSRTTFQYARTTTGAQTKAGKVTYETKSTIWEDYGGSLEVFVNQDIPGAIDVKLTGPYMDIPGYAGPYKVAASDGSNEYAALSVIGRGVKSDAKTLSLRTGSSEIATKQEVGKTINNPFISGKEKAYQRGVWASLEAAGPRVTLSATIPTTVGVFSFIGGGVPKKRIEGFGLVAGALVQYNNSIYRIDNATLGNLGTSFTASRFVTVEDFDALWETKTVSYHDGVWYGFDVQDQIVIPFYGEDIVDGYISLADDGNPYLNVTSTGDTGNEAELLFDTDGTPYYEFANQATLLELDVDFTPYYV